MPHSDFITGHRARCDRCLAAKLHRCGVPLRNLQMAIQGKHVYFFKWKRMVLLKLQTQGLWAYAASAIALRAWSARNSPSAAAESETRHGRHRAGRVTTLYTLQL